jgi:hypothetical protein
MFKTSRCRILHLTLSLHEHTMEFDEQAADAKRREVRDAALVVRHSCDQLPDEDIDAAIEAFSRITPPEEPDTTVGYITIRSPYTVPRAQSRKPGNVFLSWRKLMDIVPDVSLAGLGAATLPIAPPWATVLAALYIWNKVSQGSIEEFSEIEATTILALWKNRDGENRIAETDGFAKVNELRAGYSLPPLTQGQFASAVDRLVDIRCVELSDGIIRLRETVRVKYR